MREGRRRTPCEEGRCSCALVSAQPQQLFAVFGGTPTPPPSRQPVTPPAPPPAPSPAPQKHIDDIPELKAEKMAMNRRTLKAMQVGRGGGVGRFQAAAVQGGLPL